MNAGPAPAPPLPGPAPAGRWGLRSLQGRLLWSMVLVLVAALGGLGLLTVHDASIRLQQEQTARARALARSVALTIVNPLLTRQLDQVEDALLRLALLPGLRELRVIDPAGKVLDHVEAVPDGDPVPRYGATDPVPPPAEPRPVVLEQRAADGRRVLVAWHPIGAGNRPVGWTQAVHTLDELDALQREVIWRTLAAGAAAALVGTLGLLWLLRAPLASLREAAQFARQLRRADGAQLPQDPHAPHETRSLVESLNDSSTRLATQAGAITRALADVRRHRDALDQHNHELDAILSISPSGLLALDAQDRVHFASAAFGRYTGLDPAQLVDLPLTALEQLLRERSGAPRDWPGFDGAFAAVAPGGAAPLLALSQPQPRELRLERGRVDTAGIACLISAQDVTHEQVVDRLKSEFLSTAAHELRTPMVSIHGFTELLLTRRHPPERQRTMLEAVHRNSTLMIHVINELLDLARIEARRGADFDRGPLELTTLVRQVVADFQPPEGRARPQVLADERARPMWGDRDKLRQVLFNLLSNAFKYSAAPQGVTVQLLDRAPLDDAAPAQVGFAVVDQGIGMTPEQAARVFERFYRADPSGTVLGTGLGMAIVQEIVHLHGGQVDVDSRAGEGTTARVWLPRRDDLPALPGGDTSAATAMDAPIDGHAGAATTAS